MKTERVGHPEQVTSAERGSVVAAILRALDGIRFGSVEIVVHDSRVVQIERRERVRINEPSRARPAEGDRPASA